MQLDSRTTTEILSFMNSFHNQKRRLSIDNFGWEDRQDLVCLMLSGLVQKEEFGGNVSSTILVTPAGRDYLAIHAHHNSP